MIRFLVRLFLLLILLVIVGLGYALWPRKADLRNFDADAVARLETAMWRDYYNHDQKALAMKLYTLNREQYHFSPADSARLAYYAGQAAKLFQPTTSRAEAQAALPMLVSYFTLMQGSSGEEFDPGKAAQLELEWWQSRRESSTPMQYSKVIAQVSEEIFHASNQRINKAANQRAAMMGYRDARRDGRMRPEDWALIEQNLIESFRNLKAGVERIAR